jgi:hypothetical protein
MLDSGGYVLGALPPAEREEYESHLAECGTCRDEVADLAVLPGLLGRLDSRTAAEVASGAVVVPITAPDTVLPKALWALQAKRAGQRRRRRWQAWGTGLVAACLAIIAGLGAGLIINNDSGTTTYPTVAMRSVFPEVPVGARLALVPTEQGTRIQMHCWYHNEGNDRGQWWFRLFVYSRAGGEPEQVGTWTAKYGDDFTETFPTGLPPNEIARIELRRGDNTTLLVYESI